MIVKGGIGGREYPGKNATGAEMVDDKFIRSVVGVGAETIEEVVTDAALDQDTGGQTLLFQVLCDI